MTITKWYNLVHLDELPEYKRSVLEVMRQPLEDRKITVSRAYDRILKVSRTIADLEASPDITMNHLRAHGVIVRRKEAISYRELDKEEQWF